MLSWDELQTELLRFMGKQVTIAVLITTSPPTPIVGLEGVLINAKPVVLPGSDKFQAAVALRVRPDGTDDVGFLNILRHSFEAASWEDWAGTPSLVIRSHDLLAVVSFEDEVLPAP